MEEAKQFLEMMNKALPGAWDAAVRQVYIYGALCTLGTIVCIVIGAVCLSHINNISDDTYSGDHFGTEAVICLIAVAIIGLLCLFGAGMYFINPEYHALQMVKP